MKRKIIAFLTTVILLSLSITNALPVHAIETGGPIMPLLNNANVTIESFVVVDGVAYAMASYSGYDGVTTGATMEIKLQRKCLFWWQDLDIGQPNNTWTDEVTGWHNSVLHTFSVGEGEYRAKIKYTIRGSGGEDDVIEKYLYDDYS